MGVPRPEADPSQPFHTAVHCYLATLHSLAEALDQACPAVGGPYHQRIARLRSRLAFDSNPAALDKSRTVVEAELADYARHTAAYVDRHGLELRRGLAGLEEIVRTMALRQDFYTARLRQFAEQMETTAYPPDPDHLAEVVAMQAAGLMSCVESLSHESRSLSARMREELAQVERRISEAEITDPITGLMNRREMERRIATAISGDYFPTLLLIEFSCSLPDDVARQAAERLTAQFRHNDLIARWTDCRFVVIFHGSKETACARVKQIIPWIAGQYLLANGETLEVSVQARLIASQEELTTNEHG